MTEESLRPARLRAEAGRDNDRRQNDAKHASDHAQARWPERVLETHHEEMKFLEGLERQKFAKEICEKTRGAHVRTHLVQAPFSPICPQITPVEIAMPPENGAATSQSIVISTILLSNYEERFCAARDKSYGGPGKFRFQEEIQT